MKKAYSAAIFKEGKLLIVQRCSDEDSYAEYWELPGGGAEENETLEAALTREVFEETALKVIHISKPYYAFSYGDTHEQHCMVQAEGELHLNPQEHQGFKWINSPQELEALKMSQELQQSVIGALGQERRVL